MYTSPESLQDADEKLPQLGVRIDALTPTTHYSKMHYNSEGTVKAPVSQLVPTFYNSINAENTLAFHDHLPFNILGALRCMNMVAHGRKQLHHEICRPVHCGGPTMKVESGAIRWGEAVYRLADPQVMTHIRIFVPVSGLSCPRTRVKRSPAPLQSLSPRRSFDAAKQRGVMVQNVNPLVTPG